AKRAPSDFSTQQPDATSNSNELAVPETPEKSRKLSARGQLRDSELKLDKLYRAARTFFVDTGRAEVLTTRWSIPKIVGLPFGETECR
ncbi:MAG TPA: hypothetical protein P5307_11175, partial [Pirellulaceae bacterium]|nr:hypothetical protein [Pirellulaceae bacterium]